MINQYKQANMEIKKILNGVDYKGEFNDFDVKNISYDSRKVTNGTLFVAVKGKNFDGHDFIDEAIKNGAIAIVKNENSKRNPGIIEVGVKDTRKTLSKLANNFFNNPSSKIGTIGVTGTNGKTTTTYLINRIFNDCGLKTGSIGTLGFISPTNLISTGFTTPESLELNNFIDKLIKGGVKHVVLEASSHALALNRLDNIIIDTAIYTNLSREHLDFHKDMNEYFSEKLKLFTSLSKNANSIINIDDKYSKRIINNIKSKIITYGFNSKADIYPVSYQMSYSSMEFQISLFNNLYKINTNITGKHNIYNIMASIAACIINNIPIELIIKSLKNIKSIPGRMEFIGNENNKVFIDYAHTPDAYNNILKLINDIKAKNHKVITLFGCGGDRDKLKRPEMAKISEKYSDKIIVTTDNPRTENIDKIMNDILIGFKEKKHIIIKNRETALIESIKMLNRNSILLVLGKGRETYQLVNQMKIDHNDIEIIKREINES